MDTNKITLVDELDASKDLVNMKLRVIRRWYNPFVKEINMILIDEKGKKIQATVKKELIPQFDGCVKEDAVLLIKRLGVGIFDDKYPVIKHKLKLIFYKCTKVSPDIGFNGDLYGFSFLDFKNITVEKSRDKQVSHVDVIGSVTWCGNLEIFRSIKGESKRLNFDMRDLEGLQIRCTLWNEYAAQFNEFVQKFVCGEHLIAIIQHGILKEFRNGVTLQNDKYATRVFINEDIREANDFRRRLIVKEGAATTSGTTLSTQTVDRNRLEFLVNTPRKRIDEIREADEVMECVVAARIMMLEPELGWFFVACRKCGKKVLTKAEYMQVANDDEFTDELITAHPDSLWCRPERKIATQLTPRFRVGFRVQDSTGSASFIMWDRDVAKVIGVSASDIRSRQLSSNDVDTYPHELEGLLNQKLAFKIKIDDYNIKHSGSAFTVQAMCDDPDIIAELVEKDNVNEDSTVAEASTLKLDESSQGAFDSKDAFSVTGESLAADVEKDTDTSPIQKRALETPGVESSTKGQKRVRKMKI